MLRFTSRDVSLPLLRTLLMVSALGLAVISGACSCGEGPSSPVSKPVRPGGERVAAILRRSAEILPGMTAAEVEVLMGKADEVFPLYEPVVFNPRQLGTTHWYLIERSAAGVASSKAVRVSYDLDGRVTGVDAVGLDHASPVP